MSEVLMRRERTARKTHSCDYCGSPIIKGETYSYTVLKYEDLYEWKCHLKCEVIASALWKYIDPDEGMTEEDFQEGCQNFCSTFICPGCNLLSEGGCEDDLEYCIDKIYDILQTNKLARVMDEKRGWAYTFKLVPKEMEVAND